MYTRTYTHTLGAYNPPPHTPVPGDHNPYLAAPDQLYSRALPAHNITADRLIMTARENSVCAVWSHLCVGG